jgi:hypothetical protein
MLNLDELGGGRGSCLCEAEIKVSPALENKACRGKGRGSRVRLWLTIQILL